MELCYKNLSKHPRLLLTVTGLRFNEFELLKIPFEYQLNKHFDQYTFEGKHRKRKRTIRKNSIFERVEDQLIFILYYYKNYPTQEKLGLQFNLAQCKVSAWINLLEPLLIGALKKLKMTPVRQSEEIDNRMIESIAMSTNVRKMFRVSGSVFRV